MAIKSFRPLTAAGRFTQLNQVEGLTKKRPERALTEPKHKTGGRNVYGRVTSRHRGGGHKQLYRIIDFKRALLDQPAKVQALEYDPNRTANLALLSYSNGTKAYILAPKGLKVGDTIFASNQATTNDFNVGNNFPLAIIPPSTRLHCVELVPGRGAQIAQHRSQLPHDQQRLPCWSKSASRLISSASVAASGMGIVGTGGYSVAVVLRFRFGLGSGSGVGSSAVSSPNSVRPDSAAFFK